MVRFFILMVSALCLFTSAPLQAQDLQALSTAQFAKYYSISEQDANAFIELGFRSVVAHTMAEGHKADSPEAYYASFLDVYSTAFLAGAQLSQEGFLLLQRLSVGPDSGRPGWAEVNRFRHRCTRYDKLWADVLIFSLTLDGVQADVLAGTLQHEALLALCERF